MGLDHSRYSPGKKKTSYPTFVFVARLVKMKRAELCIRAMSLFVKEFPQSMLTIFGNGPQEAFLAQLISELGLEKNVTLVTKNNFYLRKDSRDPKTVAMQESWVLLLPSVKEGWGMVVTEAAACGTPAIVSDVTGLRDSVQNGKTGIVLSKNPTQEELYNAMKEFVNDSTRKKLSSRATIWSKKFTWDKSYETFKKYILA
jgi:glycosyltransferase involved in cell wall biosynthesis